MLTQYPARDTAAPKPTQRRCARPRELPQALRAVLDALAIADAKKQRKQEHQDKRDGAFLGGKPDTDLSIASFAADQTATVFIGTLEFEGKHFTIFYPRMPNKRKNEGRTKVSEQCLLTDLISDARTRAAAGKSRDNTRARTTKSRRALHQ